MEPVRKSLSLCPVDDPRNVIDLLESFIRQEGLERKLAEFKAQILLNREAKIQADAIEKQRKIQEQLELSSTSKLIKIANQLCIFTLTEKKELSKLITERNRFRSDEFCAKIEAQRQKRFDKVGGDKYKNEREYYFKIIAFNFDEYTD